MAYEPTEWKKGDVVTSQKLNKLEQGVAGAGGVLVVHSNEGTLDKTWKEIRDAFCNGYYVSILFQDPTDFFYQTQILNVAIEDGKYEVGAGILQMQTWWFADSENGYPVQED